MRYKNTPIIISNIENNDVMDIKIENGLETDELFRLVIGMIRENEGITVTKMHKKLHEKNYNISFKRVKNTILTLYTMDVIEIIYDPKTNGHRIYLKKQLKKSRTGGENASTS